MVAFAAAFALSGALSGCELGAAFGFGGSAVGAGVGSGSGSGAASSASSSGAATGATDASGGGAAGLAAGRVSTNTEYDENTAVVINTAVDIYERPDRTSKRVTQALFGQPVQVIGTDGQWVHARTQDGTVGWLRLRNIDSDWTCADYTLYDKRFVVTEKEKQVMSQSRNGIVLRDIGMGTELFILEKTDNVYQIALPGNVTGWISENGMFALGAREEIPKSSAGAFAMSCEAFRGVSYLVGGASFLGIDGAGLLRVALKVNGVEVPIDLEGQYAAGDPVKLSAEGLYEPGDVLFFESVDGSGGGNGATAQLIDAGVYTGQDPDTGKGRFIHASQHGGKVMYEDVLDAYYQQRLRGVRRYF